MANERALRFLSGDIELDGLLSIPKGATRACVVCHPHPLYGGSMHNPVVAIVAEALGQRGFATLRFDFRGVGRSGGAHGGGAAEVADARAAVDALAAETKLAVAIAGYSFGAMISLRLASAHGASQETGSRVVAVAAIAPPLGMVDASFATAIDVPLLVVAGDRDGYCPVDAVESFTKRLERAESRILAETDHFFGGSGDAVAGAVADFLARA